MRLALFFQLSGDIDILAPAVEAALGEALDVRLLVVEPLRANRRLSTVLAAYGRSADHVISPAADAIALRAAVEGCDALLTASESTLRPHRLAHALTHVANEAGVATFTTQHGVENVGLTYFDQYQGIDVIFAARHVFTWAPPSRLPAAVDPITRAKAIGVGYSAPPRGMFALELALSGLSRPGPKIGVFENLHWTRYSDSYRARFLSDLEETCTRFPAASFVFKPHPEGRWLTKRFTGRMPDLLNLAIADPEDANWGMLTAPSLTPHFAAVVTTPSKAALDAALDGVPTAVASYDGRYAAYDPLPSLQSAEDWAAFIERALIDRESFAPTLRAFAERVAGGGAGAADMVRAIRRTVQSGSKHAAL